MITETVIAAAVRLKREHAATKVLRFAAKDAVRQANAKAREMARDRLPKKA